MRPCGLAAQAGHALVDSLVGLVILGIGSAGSVRWTTELLRWERRLMQDEWALRQLRQMVERGPGGDPGAGRLPGEVEAAGARFTVRATVAPASAVDDPAGGRHLDWALEWTDAAGQARSLRIIGYAVQRPRAY